MKRIICFSTGNMYKLTGDIHKQINNCLSLDVDGIELLFASATKLMKFKLSKNEIKKLRKFRFNTIHFPFYKSKKIKYLYLYVIINQTKSK